MKIIGIEGSPRSNGNTEKLVKKVLDGAAEAGADTAFFKLAAMAISPCRGCVECRETGQCILDDDMQQIYTAIEEARGIVIGSPVYVWQMSAYTKQFLERLVCFLRPDFTMRFDGPKRVLPVYTQANPDAEAFMAYFDYVEKLYTFLQLDVAGKLVATGTKAHQDVLALGELLAEAEAAGKALARSFQTP